MALLDGIQICLKHKLNKVGVELDSQVLVKMLKQEANMPWRIRSTFRKIMELSQNKSFQFMHIFREANVVANGLTNLASSTATNLVFRLNQIPRDVLGLIKLDSMGMPYIRFL